MSASASSRSGLRKVCVLGSTGSIGTSTLDVLARHPDRYEVFALSAMSRVEELAAQCLQYRPRFAVLPEAGLATRLRELLREQGCATEVLAGEAALSEIAAHPEVDAVMAAIVGSAGLAPCLAAARAGKQLLLANKEAIVLGGALFMQAVEQGVPPCCRWTPSIQPSSSACPRTATPGTSASITSCSPPPAAPSASAIRPVWPMSRPSRRWPIPTG